MGGYYARFKVIPRTAEKLIDIRTIALAGATTYRFVCGGPLMFSRLKFSQKILLAACLVVTAAFALFTLYNDYQQRNTIRAGLESDLKAMGDITAQNIENWLSGRILLVESMRNRSPTTASRTLSSRCSSSNPWPRRSGFPISVGRTAA